MEWLKSVFTEPVRAWIYRVLIAVGVALVGFGVISGEQWAMIGGVIVALLNVMPAGNTSTKL
jgi:hypothetical protein